MAIPGQLAFFPVCVIALSWSLFAACTHGAVSSSLAKQEQIVGGLGFEFWTVPSPARVGENIIFVELDAGSDKVLSELHVLLTYMASSASTPIHTSMRNTESLDTFSSTLQLTKAGPATFIVTVQSPSRPPVRATFTVTVVER